MDNFKALVQWLKQAITDNEQFHLGYTAEASEFVRFNHAKVRQAGEVGQASVQLRLIHDGRQAEQLITFCRGESVTGQTILMDSGRV